MLDPTNPARYAGDIPLSLANAAHAGTSWTPEKRGEQEIAGYCATLAHDYEAMAKYATTDAKRAALEAEFARYRTGYRRRYLVYLAARSRCLSSWIAGPSNFPVAKFAKRNRSSDSKCEDMIDYRGAALHAIRKALTPELAPVMAGDADAPDRLRAKIAKAKRAQERMKAANAAIRKHKKAGPDAQICALMALDFNHATAVEILKPDFMGRIGFADYALKNNGADVRRLEARLAEIETAHATPVTTILGDHGTYEDDPPENRVRVYFLSRRSAEVTARLKAAAFRWTPSKGCWQAYRNWKTDKLARELAGVPWHTLAWPCGHNDPIHIGPHAQRCAICGAERRDPDVPEIATSNVTAA